MIIPDAPLPAQRSLLPVEQADPANDERDPFFAPDLFMATEQGRKAVAEVVSLITAYEVEKGLRDRQRRPEDLRRFNRTVEAIVCNLLLRAFLDDPRPIAITRSKQHLCTKSRYDPWYLGKQLPDILDVMVSLDLIKQELGFKNLFGRRRTTISIEHKLEDITYELGIEDIGRLPPDERKRCFEPTFR